MKIKAFTLGGESRGIPHALLRSGLRKLLVCFIFLWAWLLTSQLHAQSTYNFSTPALLSGYSPTYPWNTTATIIIDGVSYKLTAGGNGSFTNVASGGNGNSAALKKDGSGGDSFTLSRSDGGRFQFYGMWVNHSSMYPYANTPPFYTLRLIDGSTTIKTYTESTSKNSSIAYVDDVAVTSVSISFNALLYYVIDDIKVGPAAISLPTLTTTGASNINSTFATLGGNITNDGGGAVTERGLVWSTTTNPTTGNNKLAIGTGKGSFSGQLAGLTANTTYYARAYAVNSAGTAYGNQVSFKTTDGSGPLTLTPTLDTSFDNYGSYPFEPECYTGYHSDYGQVTAALKFSLTPVTGTVSSAKLRLFVNYVSGVNPFVKVWSSTNETWTSSITSAPAVNQALGQVNVTSPGNWIELDVTDYIKAQANGSKVASLVVTGNTSSSPGEVYFNSMENGSNQPQLIITTATALSSDANLSNITLSAGTLAPVFAAGTSSYTASVDYSKSSISITPFAADNKATIKINGNLAASGSASSVSLAVGTNEITILVTAEDGTQKSYAVHVTRLPASTLPIHTLSFNGTNQYVSVPNKPQFETSTSTVEMWVKPDWTANTKGANPCIISMRSSTGTRYSIHINDNLQEVGLWNNNQYLARPYSFTKGQWYHIAAVMTTTTTEFFVNGVSIGSTANGINSARTGYELKLGASETGTNKEYFLGEMDEVRVWNTARSANEILYNYGNPVSASSTGLVAYYSIEEGITAPANAIAKKVTESTSNAFHGTLYNYYSSNANLSNLTLSAGTLSPAFAAGTTSYTVAVPFAVTSVNITPTVADATATMKVNGAAATSGSAQSISLNVGANTVPVLVTAQDGSQKTYTLTVSRAAASANADLANLSLSAGSLTPVFDAGTTSYAVTVAHDIASVDLASTVADAMATLTVDGIATTSGSAVSVSLASGSTRSVSVTVTAENGATRTYTLAITRPFPPVSASISSSTNVSCNGGANGSATVTASGGTGAFTYSWSPSGGTGATASGLAAGSYTVIVTDANGQTATANVTITQPTALATEGTQTNVSCFGGSNGSATVSVSGGTAPYTYEWSHDSRATTAMASGLAAGRYTVTVTDANSCTVTETFTITEPAELRATVATTPVTTVGGNNGEATITATGGTGAYAYSWSPSGGNGATATGLTADTYTVTIKDANNCSITETVIILEPTVTNVVAITKTAASPTNAATVGFTIAFDQPVTGVSASNFTLTTSGVSAASIASVTAVNSTTYTITVNTGTGSGEISLNLVNDNGMSLPVQNLPVNGAERYRIDKMPPAVPSAPDLLATSDSGSSDSDNITNKTTLTFEGTADPETSILFYVGTREVGTTTSDVNGNWQMIVTLTTGTHSLTAKAVDALGNTSEASAALEVAVDVTAPAQPAILAFEDEYTTGANNGFSRGNVLKLSGSAELGATVKVTLAAASQTKETVATSGAWEIDFSDLALADGTYTFEATATDMAGNESQVSASFALMIDRVAPAAPVVASISEDTGLSNTDAITSDRHVQISGTAQGGSKVTVTIGTDTYSPITAAVDGKWTLDLTTVTLADGTYTATATAQDAAGNVSDVSSTFTFVVDNAVPGAPVIAAVSEDTGVSATDGITNDQTLTISGTALAQSEVSILLGGMPIGTVVADADGNWSYTYTSAISEGAHALTAKATSVSGIESDLSTAYTLTVDITAPTVAAAATAAPVVNAPYEVSFTFSEEVNVFDLDDLALTNATATNLTSNGNVYTVSINPVTDGNVSVQLKAGALTDLAGNTNAASNTIERIYDVQLPELILATSAAQVTNAAYTVNFNFSEPVTGFDQADITVENAAVSNFSKVNDAAYTALITPVTDGEVKVSVAADVAVDVAGNGNVASAILQRKYDATQPELIVSTTATSPTNAAFTATFTFSEGVTGFEAGDIVVTNGTFSDLVSVSGSEYTALITPTADGEVLVSVAAGNARDIATNGNKASNELKLTYDATRPAIVVTTDAANPSNTAFTATFTFDEAVTGFELSDITVENGTASGFAELTKLVYTAVITPATDGEVKISVAANVAADAATNGNTASTQIAVLYDNTKPSVALATTAPANVNAPFAVTFTFDEPVTGFTVADITVSNATVSDFTATSSKEYTAMLTPATDGVVTVKILADVAQDAATNFNAASEELSRTYDATKPTVTLATTAANPTNAAFAVTFNFSEDVFGFEEGDITLGNATVADFTQADNHTYSARIIPAADGLVTVAVAAGVTADVAINLNTASEQLSLAYDATAPAGYAIAFNTNRVDVTNVRNISLNITGAEAGTTYFYTISGDNGGTEVTGTAQVVDASFKLSALDLTSLNDGTLTATLYLVDAAGNRGADATAEVIKITRDIVSVTVPEVIKVPIRTSYANVPVPAKVEVTYSTGAKEQLNVTWNQGNYNGLVAGAYELTGELMLAPMTTNLTSHFAKVTVEVQPNKVPTALAFSTTTFKPEAKPEDVIGSFSTTDPDDNEFVYTLVSGDGSKDNDLFEIKGDKLHLKSNKGLSGITQLAIRVRSTDPYSNTIEKSFTLSKELYAKPEDQLKIVNAFSPDGDGINDTWFIPELRFYNSVEIEVFDRSGVRLFHTTNPEEGWNGKDANGQVRKGAFFYIVQVRDINLVKKGVVTILKK